MKSLECDPKKGIVGTKADTDERIRVYGGNFFPPPHIKSLYELVMENFDDKINLVLLAAAGVSLAIGLLKEGFPEGMIEGSSICIALLIIIVVNSGNNYISERRLADLVKLADKQQVAVYRNNEKTISIDSEDLVVGDLYYFEKGEKIPADSLIISGQDVTCIEGELTGEADAFEKVPVTESNFNQEGLYGTLYAKSLVSTGFGTALVMAVGPKTVAGIITEKT
jgi:magnesium-transporting ATPase (P-type)